MSPRQTVSLVDTLLQLPFRFIVSTLYGAYLPRSYVGSDGLLRQHFPQNVCAVPNMVVFCSSRTSWLPGMLPTCFLNHFEMVPVAPVITGITVVFTLHIRWIYIVLLLLLLLTRKICWICMSLVGEKRNANRGLMEEKLGRPRCGWELTLKYTFRK